MQLWAPWETNHYLHSLMHVRPNWVCIHNLKLCMMNLCILLFLINLLEFWPWRTMARWPFLHITFPVLLFGTRSLYNTFDTTQKTWTSTITININRYVTNCKTNKRCECNFPHFPPSLMLVTVLVLMHPQKMTHWHQNFQEWNIVWRTALSLSSSDECGDGPLMRINSQCA